MLPNVSALRLDDKECVPCMTPVRFQDRDAQFEQHMNNFVFHETLENQIKAADCSICMEPLGLPNPGATRPAVGSEATDLYVDYCGNKHYFHKWCARTLITSPETMRCPDCRRPPTKDALTAITQSYPNPPAAAGAGAAAPAAAGAPAPVVPLNLPPLPRGTPRLGAQRAQDKLVQWGFWIKPPRPGYQATRLNNQEENAKVRSTFMQYMTRHEPAAFRVPVSNWDRRLAVTVSQYSVQAAGAPAGAASVPVTRVTCNVYLPAAAAVDFRRLFETEMQRYGLGSMTRRWLGIIGAVDQTGGNRVTANEYGTWRALQSDPAARPADPAPFQVTHRWYSRVWKVYTLEDDPLPIAIERTGPKSATDVPVEWRFWIKGSVAGADGMEFGAHVREHLSRWFRDVATGPDVATRLDIPTRVNVAASRPTAPVYLDTGTVGRVRPHTPMTRCDFQLYLPTTELAQGFVAACRHVARAGPYDAGRFAELIQQLVGVTSARITLAQDFPTIRTGGLRLSKRLGVFPYELPRKPEMSVEEYNEWQTHTLVPLAPIEQSAHEAYWEQARNERLEEPTIDPMVPDGVALRLV